MNRRSTLQYEAFEGAFSDGAVDFAPSREGAVDRSANRHTAPYFWRLISGIQGQIGSKTTI
ncbi:hypothetical protein [Halopelagius fulvigenes]|uniref:Uncharacterized protein n=1 Tax=Halopelagius fulvigenes TaxID=1198324 RepID=A0ABD5U1Y6_9EURY